MNVLPTHRRAGFVHPEAVVSPWRRPEHLLCSLGSPKLQDCGRSQLLPPLGSGHSAHAFSWDLLSPLQGHGPEASAGREHPGPVSPSPARRWRSEARIAAAGRCSESASPGADQVPGTGHTPAHPPAHTPVRILPHPCTHTPHPCTPAHTPAQTHPHVDTHTHPCTDPLALSHTLSPTPVLLMGRRSWTLAPVALRGAVPQP